LLHLAVYKKATSLILDLLLTYGIPIDILNRKGDTPLYRAVEQGHFDLVKLFLDYGASMDFENSCGQSPYLFAIQRLGFDTPYHRPETYEPICKLFRDKKLLLSGLPVAA
ncbi:MAG: ankyrin repeat domain-containing protein, partial [bacterium]